MAFQDIIEKDFLCGRFGVFDINHLFDNGNVSQNINKYMHIQLHAIKLFLPLK